MIRPTLFASLAVSLMIPSLARAQLAVGNSSGASPVSPLFAIDVNGVLPPRQLTAGNVGVNGMAADNVNRVLYWTDFNNGLFRAPITLNGALTPTGPVVLTVASVQGLAWDSAANQLIGWSDNTLYQIEPTTGVCTTISTIPIAVLSGLDYDPAADAFYAANDSTSVTPPFSGSGIYRINKPLTAPTITRLAAYPAGETDVDGLAVGNGRIYLVNETASQPIYVYNLGTNAYETNLAIPFIAPGSNSGGAWSPWFFDVPLSRSISEVEPNQTKDSATAAINLGDGQGFRGVSTSGADPDWFLVGTPRAAPGIYRNELRLYSTTPGHTATIRGLTQSAAGVIAFPSDATLQTSVVEGDARLCAVYSFGTRGQLYYRVAGISTSTANYVVRHTVVPVTPVDVGEFYSGPIRIVGDVTSTHDSDFWVYDASFNPVATFGHDDNDTTGATRNLGPGDYYIAMGSFNIANDQASPADDTFRAGNVMEFPGVVARSTTPGFSGQFSVADADGGRVTSLAITQPFEIAWFKFTVVDQDFCVGDANRDGAVDGDDVIFFFENWDNGC